MDADSPAGPLDGLLVLEIASIGPGPLACTLLADLGASVLRIVRPGENPRGPEGLGQGRPHRELDLRSPDGVAAFLDLVERADVLIEGGRPGTVEKLGIGPAACLARNRNLVFGRVTGWGQDGPLVHDAGHDINYIALTGALHAIGPPDQPVPPLNLVGDYAGGALFLVVGVLAALRSGIGQVVDAAMVDGASYLLSQQHDMLTLGSWTDSRASNPLDGGEPYYRTYRCADDEFVAVGCLEPKFFALMCERLGLSELVAGQHDASRWPAMAAAIGAVFATRTRDEWSGVFAGSDACVTPVLGLTEAAAHPHVAARGTYLPVPGGVRPAPAPRFSASRGRPSHERVEEQRARWDAAPR